MTDFEYVIIGGAVHGAHIVNQLVNDEGLATSELAVFDPEGYGEVSDQRTSDSGTHYLRSPEVHYVAENPFKLKDYGEGRHKQNGLISEGTSPKGSFIGLFVGHLEYVVDSNVAESSESSSKTCLDVLGAKSSSLRPFSITSSFVTSPF